MLGSTKLSFASLYGDVFVSRKRDVYRTLRLHVGGTPLELTNVRVIFVGGDAYTPGESYAFGPGNWTHQIKLPEPRMVDRVVFQYRATEDIRGSSTIRLFGQH